MIFNIWSYYSTYAIVTQHRNYNSEVVLAVYCNSQIHTCHLPVFTHYYLKPIFVLVCLIMFCWGVCAEILYFTIDISGIGYFANIFIAICAVLILHLHKTVWWQIQLCSLVVSSYDVQKSTATFGLTVVGFFSPPVKTSAYSEGKWYNY